MSWNRAKRDKHYPESLVRSGQVMAQSKELTRERERDASHFSAKTGGAGGSQDSTCPGDVLRCQEVGHD